MPISEFPGWGSGWISDGAVSFYNDYPVQVNQRGPSFQLTIQVWQGASYQAALLSPFLGEGSITWTEPGVIPNDAAETFRGFPDTPIYVTPEPKPSAIALFGLGAAALLIRRCRGDRQR